MTSPRPPALATYINMTELLDRVGDDRGLLLELLELFQEDLPRVRQDLKAAVETDDPIQVAKAAHALKGVFASLSMNQATELATNLELAARAADSQRISRAIHDLDREEAGLTAAVESFLAQARLSPDQEHDAGNHQDHLNDRDESLLRKSIDDPLAEE